LYILHCVHYLSAAPRNTVELGYKVIEVNKQAVSL